LQKIKCANSEVVKAFNTPQKYTPVHELSQRRVAMLPIPDALFIEYVSHLKNRKIPPDRFSEYKKWLRYYLDFCDKYSVPDAKSERVRLFCEKLLSK
jgi:hypothetical protein